MASMIQFTQRKQKIYPFLDEEILSVTPYSHFHEIKTHMRSLQKNIQNWLQGTVAQNQPVTEILW